MRTKLFITALACLSSAQQASAQQPSARQDQSSPLIAAQILDRCMATYAVRLTKTGVSDDVIYAQTRQSCLPLNDQLTAAIRAQFPPAQATEMVRSRDAQEKSAFMSMVARIRSDRAKRAGGHNTTATPTAAHAAFNPTNPAHCEVALGMLVIIADAFSLQEAPDLRRRLALAKQQSAARFSTAEATAARKAVWPLMSDQSALVKFGQACPK